MSLPERLSSTGKEDSPSLLSRKEKKEEGEPPDAETTLIQRCVIIQKDEKGYGFTVSGDNPVYVASVKTEGAASRSGVQQGDKILKVNGTLVTNRNHLDVVKLIKSGSYVALTLLGKPNTGTGTGNTTLNYTPSFNISSLNSNSRVTAPQPVNADKDRELWQQKVHMTKAMHETAIDDYQKLQRMFAKNPSEKLQAQLLEKERTVKALENQLHSLKPDGDEGGPTISAFPKSNRYSDSEHGSLDSFSVQSWASSLPATTTTSDLGSMSDSPQTSPSISPTPNDAHMRHNGQDEDSALGMTPDIITIDDEDINLGNNPATDPGPFVDIKHLESKPAHMAVLLRYLISNSDPSYVLFHIIADAYRQTSASIKELRKWAYEIYSTFVIRSAPLSILAEDNVISQIDNLLTISAARVDNEMGLRNIFQSCRQAIQGEIAELLSDFRHKKDLGMGNFYGFQRIYPNMDKQAEIKAAEEILIPYLEQHGYDDGTRTISDRDQATSWGVASFLRLNGSSKSHHHAILDRVQTFMMKDRRSIKFSVTRSGRAKSVKNHQFNLQHFYTSTACNSCGHNIWGVGYQGFQCQNCDMVVHRTCVDEINEVCGGKAKKRTSRLIPNVLPTRKTSSTSQSGMEPSYGVRPHTELHSPSFSDLSGPGPFVQPVAKDEDSELAGLPTGHSVKHIVSRYQDMQSPTGPGPGLGVPGGTPSTALYSTGDNERRGSTDLNRSGSLNNKGEKGDRPARRAKSDVDVDSEAFKAINQSGSSSASSMSNRSGESPSNSTDNVNEMLLVHHEDPDIELEPELPPLKQVLGEDVLRKLKPKEKKRQDVINELIYTERAHLRNLKIMDTLFNKPMLADRGMSRDLACALFPNMEEMILLHESLTKDLRERQKANPVVKEVGDLLLKRFDGEKGDIFRKACAEYCRNQSFTLDALKRGMRKEPKLAQFLSDAELNPLCRRLHLKDLVPSQVHRLTKYPLLIDNLLKYTPANSEEHKHLERALERAKHILAYVNQAVKECENYHKLKEIQKKLDKKVTEANNDPAMADIKGLDLTKGHKLIFDSPLTMKIRANRTVDLHVLLLDSLLVMLQKQDERYVLKYQNSNAPSLRDSNIKDETKYTHSPVLYVRNILARHVATDKKSFFVVNMSESRAQMYEFIAATSDLRIKWCDMISEQTEAVKKTNQNELGHIATPPPRLESIEMERNSVIRQQLTGTRNSNLSVDDQNLDQVDNLGRFEVTDLISDTDLIQPDEVSVSNVITTEATSVRTTEAAIPTDDTGAEGDSGGSSSSSSTQSQIPVSPGQTQEQEAKPQANVSLPMEQLKGMAVEMNSILAKLMSTMNSGSEERHRWRMELQEAQHKLNALKEQQRQLTLSGAVPPDPVYDDTDDMDVSQTAFSPVSKPPLLPLSPTSSPSQPTQQVLAERTLLVSKTCEEVHHGIQEAIMDESVETLASGPSTEVATMVGQGEEDERMIEVAMRDDDDDDDNEVSVAGLPLPDVGTIETSSLDAKPSSTPRLLDVVDLDDSDDVDDDNDTLVSKGDHPDLSSLSSVSIEGSHPTDSSITGSGAGPQAIKDSTGASRSASESRDEGTEVDDDSKDDECTPIEI